MQKIDVVIPWVDGNDPIHREKIEALTGSKNNKSLDAATQTERFFNSNEIYYCINSILKFMPWVNHIYLVTDNQTPGFLTQSGSNENYDKVKIIDHTEIFRDYENVLPTFNTRSIATCLWRIKGISNNFIVFNDDHVVIDSLAPQNFFRNDKVVFYGKFLKSNFLRESYFLKKLWSKMYLSFKGILLGDRASVAQKTAKLFGNKKKFFINSHMPISFIKNDLSLYFNQNPGIFYKQISFKFRSFEQYLPELINFYLQYSKNNTIIVRDNESPLYTLSYTEASKMEFCLQRDVLDTSPSILCLQSIEKFPREVQTELFEKLNKIIFSK